MRRTSLIAPLALMLSACGTILGIDDDDSDSTPGSSSSGDAGESSSSSSGESSSGRAGSSSSGAGSSGTSGSSGGSSGDDPDAGILGAPECGQMAAYAASPWPMAGACPTRPSMRQAPALQNAHILWRKDYGVNDAFVSAPSIGADGTVYAVAAISGGNGFEYDLVGVLAGTETMRVTLPGLATEAPTIAADGTLYLRTQTQLIAVSPTGTGSIAWTRSVASSTSDSPVLLSDGTIVTVAGHDLVFTTPAGAAAPQTVSLGATQQSPTFRGSIGVSPTGILYVTATTAPAVFGGMLYAYSPDGSAYFPPKPLDSPGEQTPAFTASGDLLITPYGALEVRDRTDGHQIVHVSAGHSYDEGRPARSGNQFVFPGDVNGPYSFDTVTGVRTDYGDVAGRFTGFVATGDGSLIFARRDTFDLDPPTRAESWRADGTTDAVWLAEIDSDTPSSYTDPALDANGTVYLTFARTLYAIGD